MHHHQLLIFFALLIFAFGLFSRIAEKKSVTGLAGNEHFMSIIFLTVMISVYAHGISALPLSKAYGKSTSFK